MISRISTLVALLSLAGVVTSAAATDNDNNGFYRPDLAGFIVVPEDDGEQQRQVTSSDQEYLGRNVLQQLDIKYDITAETTGLMGEQIDLSSGAVNFLQTDIDIPGNSAIPVRLARSWGGPDRWYGANRFFANWNFELAYVSTTMASANDVYFTGSWAQNIACSGSLNPQTSLSKGGAVLQVNDYWNGDSVYIPGQGSTTLLTSSATSRTTKNNWKVTCFNSTKGYEGFKITTPDGLTYTFDQLRMVRGQDLVKSGPVEGPIEPGPIPNPDPGHGGGGITFSRYHTFMLISRVDDRFGNWVSYSYSGNNLSRIDASDGRAITLQYSNNRVSSASAHGKTWSYGYNSNALTSVNRPDGRSWQFNHSQAAFYDQAPNTEGRCLNNDQRVVPHHLVTMTHPSGVVGTFTVKSVLHGRTEVPKLQLGPVNDNNYRYAFAIDRCYNTIALTQKTLSGAGVPTSTWQYSYSENEGAFINETKQAISVIGGGLPSGMIAGDLKYTRVKAPDNSVTVHYFNRRFDWREGSEVFTDQFDTNGTTRLRRTLKTFAKGSNFGSASQQYSNAELSSHAVLTTKRQIAEQTDSYTTDYSAFNVYSTPTLVKESNSLSSQSRWQRTTFYHDSQNWLLNQPAKLEYSADNSNWSTVQQTSYYSASHSYKSLPYQKLWYGNLISTFNSYHADGNLKQHSYNVANRWVQFENYKRGKAQLIKLPQRYTTSCSNPASCYISASQTVNDDGTVAQVTDLNGNRTSYQYDAMRRLTKITPADTRWAATTISYPTESGRLTQHISQGNYRKKITFDGLLRPTLTQEWDAAVSGTTRYTVQRFNVYNKAVFTSYPSTSSTESQGMAFEFDGLQRLTREYNTVTNSGNNYYYLAGNQKRTENARGYNTYTHYHAWGEPAYELPLRIENNDSLTSLNYNLFDNPSSITQGGITESRIYNAQQRLCRMVRPDVGHTAYSYNVLGEVIWSAPGASGGATACNESAVTAAQKVSHSYDNLGELRTLSYPDSTQNKVHTLDNQGNLTRLTAGTVSWSYSYNSKHLPQTESLSYDGRTFNLGWSYNNLGHVSSLTYPGGGVVAFNPNALGQARQAGSFANAASYYPNGQPSQFTFGNGIIRSYALDSQRRPQQLRDYYGSTNFINFSYGYDNNHNVTSISDSLVPAYNLSLGYDASDRLDVANGQWGSGSFDYDALGNITQQKLGSSTLNYQYSNNRLSSVSGSQSRSFSYDSRGNITNNGLRSLSYNLANQLTASGNLSYVYDGHNRLVKRTNSSGSSYHVYSQNGKLLHEVASNGSPTDYVYLGNQLVAKVKGATPSYVHNDLLGSPRLETNTSRVIQSNSRQHYQPFGQRIPDSNYTDIGFTGHKHDGELGLTYMQARYYDPVIGRFYSNDPVGFTASNPMMFNRYAYANNNPYKFSDPNGRNPILVSRVMMPPPAIPTNTAGPNIPGHPGLPSNTGGSSPSLPNIPISDTSISGMIATIAKAVIAGSDSSKERKGQGQAEVGKCPDPECGGKTSDKTGKIAKDQGMPVKDVEKAIHGLKNDASLPNNSNVEVCKECGEIFPQGSDGTLGDSIGNIKEK